MHGPYRSLYSLQGDSAKRRCRHGVRHDGELNTVTGSCSYEPNSTKALKSLVSYIAPLRMTRAAAVYGDAGMRAGAGRATPVRGTTGSARYNGMRREGTKKKGPLKRFAQGARESSGDLLSRTRGPGTIGDLRLNFRVRDGNGCDPHSITAETISCMEI